MDTWDSYFLKIAKVVSTKSKDPSTKHGCVIVGPTHEIRTTGYNGFPRGMVDDERYNNREVKYMFVEHAERNAIYNASRYGISLDGCTLYVTGTPCNDCCRGIIQSGIVRVVMLEDSEEFFKRWKESIKCTLQMFNECHIEYEYRCVEDLDL